MTTGRQPTDDLCSNNMYSENKEKSEANRPYKSGRLILRQLLVSRSATQEHKGLFVRTSSSESLQINLETQTRYQKKKSSSIYMDHHTS
jgi:hypothetical protein